MSDLSDLGMDPPREIMVSYISEDSVTVSWAHPLAHFDYYKMSYQCARGMVTCYRPVS